jgi:hypothetical protein
MLYEDEELKNSKEIFINIEDIKLDDFENLSTSHKYSILMIFIKHLLPLVDLSKIDDPDKFIKKSLHGVQIKSHIKKKENKQQITNITHSTTMYSSKMKFFPNPSKGLYISRDLALDMLYSNEDKKSLLPNIKIKKEHMINHNLFSN